MAFSLDYRSLRKHFWILSRSKSKFISRETKKEASAQLHRSSWRLFPAYLFTSLPYRLTSSRLRLRPPPGLAYFQHFSSPWILQTSYFYLLIARIKSLIHTSSRYISASFSKVVPFLNGRKCADFFIPAFLQDWRNKLPNDSFVSGCLLTPQINARSPVGPASNVIWRTGRIGKLTSVRKPLFSVLMVATPSRTLLSFISLGRSTWFHDRSRPNSGLFPLQ